MELNILNLNVDFVVLSLFGFVGKYIKYSIFRGTTHYCEPCHSGRNPNMNKPCPGPEKCPLGVNHKPTG